MDNQKDNFSKSKKKNTDKEINLSEYGDKDKGFMRRLNFGLWFMKNRKSFIISLILVLIFLSVFLYSKFFYNLYLYIKNRPEEVRILRELSTITVNFGAARSADPLSVGTPKSFFHNNKYDFVNKIKNPNNSFISFVNYCFTNNEVEVACGRITIFPEEDKYAIILAVDLESRVNNLGFVVKNINWQRVDAKRYGTWSDYYQERNNFLISNINFESSPDSQARDITSNNLSFKIKNSSPYNYWEVPLSIVLFNQNNIVGVNKYTVFNLMSLEERNITLSWKNSLNTVSKVEIISDLDVLSEDNYIRYK